jgi:hypothetical protein
MPDFLEHASASEHNFKVGLVKDTAAVHLFGRLDQHVTAMVQHLAKLPEISSPDAFFFLGTFLAIFQRQIRNAFSLFLRRMSYDALLVSRPGIEAAIFAYRIFRNRDLLKVWVHRNDDFKEFSRHFRFADLPGDMPYRKELEQHLDRLNDYWAHPSINYFSSSVRIGEGNILVHFFDEDQPSFYLSLLAYLDVCLKALALFRHIWADRFNVFVASTEDEYRHLLYDFEVLKTPWREERNLQPRS